MQPGNFLIIINYSHSQSHCTQREPSGKHSSVQKLWTCGMGWMIVLSQWTVSQL